jgi:hypothetical protein
MSRPDRNYKSYADVFGVTIQDARFDPAEAGLDPQAFDDTLKFSNASEVHAENIFVRGGRENAVDMNRGCHDIAIQTSTLVGGNQCAIVIKGGSHDIALGDVMIREAVGRYDIELGGWSDQSFEKTRRILLHDVRRDDGKPVRVAVGHAEKPDIEGGNVKILFFESLALKAFWWGKFVLRKLKIA